LLQLTVEEELPLKQGLKLFFALLFVEATPEVEEELPLKQGLKQQSAFFFAPLANR